MAKLFTDAFYTAQDENGATISGAKWNFYLTGTTTRHDTFTDNAKTVAHANPVIADSAGRFAPIYLQDADYKAVLTDAADVVIKTVDPVHGAEAVDPADLDAANIFTKTTTWKHGNDVASAAALTLGDGNIFDITGTIGITSIGTKGVGTIIVLHFDGILTLTHNATDLVLPNGANITTAAGDIAIFEEYAAADWRLINYTFGTQGVGLVSIADPPGAISTGTDVDHEIDIAAGTWKAKDAASNITLGATTIDIELAGNGGRLDSETLDINTWYAVLSGRNTSDGAFVAGFKKTDAKPTGWDFYRRHGWRLTDGTSNLLAATQDGDNVQLDVPIVDLTTATSATIKTNVTVSTPPGTVQGQFRVQCRDGAASYGLIFGSNETDVTPIQDNSQFGTASSSSRESITILKTAIDSTISYRTTLAMDNLSIFTEGWIDGRDRH